MAQVLWKKKEGILALSKNKNQLSWSPSTTGGAPPELTVLVPNITNLQQTPPDKPKVMLKLTTQSANNLDPVVHTFTFSSATQARAEADSLKESLRKAIQEAQQQTSKADVMETDSSGVPNALAIASAVKKPGEGTAAWLSDEQLLSDLKLQQELLKADSNLSNTFMESMRTKPDSMSGAQFAAQFWSARVNVLRAGAIEKSQNKGAYNVLASVKTFTDSGTIKMNITQEQIHLIFTQYPLVQRIYDETVEKAYDDDAKAKLSDRRFWTRFFQSRLLKKLKGERITDLDPKDNVFDKYLSQEEQARLNQRLYEAHIPRIIDMAGNEVNHSQRQGNRPDFLMRPNSLDKVPIIRKLNWMSEEIMSQVAPNDVDPSEPIGMDEETFNELALRDLQADPAENRLVLNVKDQKHFFSSGKDASADSNFFTATSTTPAQLLNNLRATAKNSTVHPPSASTSLSTSLGLNPDSSSSEDEEDDDDGSHKLKLNCKPLKPSLHFSSHRAMTAASQQVFSLIAQQRAQNPALTSILPAASDPSSTTATGGPSSTPLNSTSLPFTSATTNLSQAITTRLSLLQASTTEFLSYFYKAFYSGDPSQAGDLAVLAQTVENSLGRIEAVAKDAEEERKEELERRKRALVEKARRLGRKVGGFDESAVKGGKEAVEELMAATKEAVQRAGQKYKAAVAEEMGQGVAEG